MARITIYPRKKHSNRYTHRVIDENFVCVMQSYHYQPLVTVLFPASIFTDILRDAKMVFLTQSKLSLHEVTEQAFTQYFKYMVTYKGFRKLALCQADFIFKNIQ